MIVSQMKSRQCKFYHKFKQLNQNEATARKILEMCSHLEVSNYYESLPDTIEETAKEQMRLRICESPSTYNSRYYNITECKYNSALYNELLNERKRVIISRWRLSSHQVKIETGRYTTNKTPRNDRHVMSCNF